MKYAMNLNNAIALGKQFAVQGWSEAAVGDWLLDNGYGAATAARIQRAYVDQLARG